MDTAASTLNQATLDVVASVMAEQCGSAKPHAFIEGKIALDKKSWAKAGQRGWLRLGIPEQFGGLGIGAQGLAIAHGELGQQSAPGPYLATSSAAQTIVDAGGEAVRQTCLPRLAFGDISAAVPATLDVRSLTRSGVGVSAKLHCLGATDAAVLLARADNAWVNANLAGAELTVVPMGHRTRDVIDIRPKDATPVGILPDAAASRAPLMRARTLTVAAESPGGVRSITERTIAYMKTREQFSQRIAGFQALEHREADLAPKLAVADEVVGARIVVTEEPDAELWASPVNSEITEACVLVTTDCVQLHRGVGFTWSFDPRIDLSAACRAIRNWMAKVVPPDGKTRMARASNEEYIAFQRWRMAERSKVVRAIPHWPKQYGGAGLSRRHLVAVADEMARADAPRSRLFTISLIHMPARCCRTAPRRRNAAIWPGRQTAESGAGAFRGRTHGRTWRHCCAERCGMAIIA